MKKGSYIISLLALCSSAYAEDPKPLATQAAEATAPVARSIGSGINRITTEFLAGTDGFLGEGARANLKMQDKHEREANRGVRKSMKDCIKPGNVIDDDVKECTEGLRLKTW
ncbi:hypothetical protein VV867_03000 [Pseudomonas sp. JH-2]|uniref:hypothetical protein n=1 Tax=Pseudomonas sp. JH-2 TaxID=3114998 RepID=UPI002E26CDDA|nr:hypothetical protein [Pseudomonas sp. JH-2]